MWASAERLRFLRLASCDTGFQPVRGVQRFEEEDIDFVLLANTENGAVPLWRRLLERIAENRLAS